MTGTNGNGNGSARVGTDKVKQGLAQMLKGGVIVSFFVFRPCFHRPSPTSEIRMHWKLHGKDAASLGLDVCLVTFVLRRINFRKRTKENVGMNVFRLSCRIFFLNGGFCRIWL
jgi:hypothetical protein